MAKITIEINTANSGQSKENDSYGLPKKNRRDVKHSFWSLKSPQEPAPPPSTYQYNRHSGGIFPDNFQDLCFQVD